MRTFLDGEVRIRRLERVRDGGPFMAEDLRGAVAFPVVGESFEYIHVVEFAHEGVRRGLHAHPGHEEQFVVFRGEMRLAARSARTSDSVVLELSAGDLVIMAPGVAHALQARAPAMTVHFGRGADPLRNTVPAPELQYLLDPR